MKGLSKVAIIFVSWMTAVAEDPVTIPNERFIEEIQSAVATAETKSPEEVELLGWGTASLLDSHRESKIRCGKGNPNPKPGECSDSYPIYPDPNPLATVVANEQGTKVEAKATATAWIAWRDLNGVNIAFNSRRIGDYELSTVTEVEQDGRWTAIRIYSVTVKYQDKGWIDGPRIADAGFTCLTLGAANDSILERLEVLTKLGVIADVKLDPQVGVAIAAAVTTADMR
ncbi:MAG: hypothetical protein KF886_10315 [Candidatus Hydrogenedentes bacterium]|nr:hypothetical protein [Candidatus Hydrogenedentota bacterium]